MNISHARNVLISLYKIVEAGEKGYAVVASNVRNRALKILFQACSQQRQKFKEEIFEEIQQLGGQARPKSSVLGMIHRGRIDIFSHFTIGDENVERMLLKEVLLGERVAVRAYERTLEQDLPPEAHALIDRQFREVRQVVDQMQRLRGQNGKRLVLRLYDTRKDAEQAFQSLKNAGISQQAIKIEDYSPPALEPSESPPTTIFETILSGAIGGQIWGVVAGVLAAATIVGIAALNQGQASPVVALVAMLVLMAQGALVGGMIGLFIGWGVTSQDKYVAETVKQGEVLMQTLIDESLASKAWKIMNQVAVAARARHASESPA
ncbi:MAG TPA: PA2169 family four-helix-bundle protein [Anaerolineales bacterium]|nr:PA2169 family four-helix-bundle protein [Anaerolineales bacterium]